VLLGPDDVGEIPEVIEDGETFEHNARKKALEIAADKGLAVLSDDSGLEVDALGGKPGVRSARYAGEHASDEDNNRKLVTELAHVPLALRSARYRVVLAFVDPGVAPAPLVHCVQGSCEGRIRFAPSGTGGFGYDPYFEPEGFDCTLAELAPAQKNRISHRARAAFEMREFLSSHLARRFSP